MTTKANKKYHTGNTIGIGVVLGVTNDLLII
jgi:hypothetical protein